LSLFSTFLRQFNNENVVPCGFLTTGMAFPHVPPQNDPDVTTILCQNFQDMLTFAVLLKPENFGSKILTTYVNKSIFAVGFFPSRNSEEKSNK